jgi:hypothetical protein
MDEKSTAIVHKIVLHRPLFRTGHFAVEAQPGKSRLLPCLQTDARLRPVGLVLLTLAFETIWTSQLPDPLQVFGQQNGIKI